MWAPTKWQRVVLLAAATACFANAWRLYSDDDPAGTSFVAGILFLIAGLTRPSPGEDWLPAMPGFIARNRRGITLGALALAIAGAAFAFWSEQARLSENARLQRMAETAERDRVKALAAIERKIRAAYEVCLRKGQNDELSKTYSKYHCEYIRDQDLAEARERPDPIAATLEAMNQERATSTE